jgi:hypothetical protein
MDTVLILLICVLSNIASVIIGITAGSKVRTFTIHKTDFITSDSYEDEEAGGLTDQEAYELERKRGKRNEEE